MWLLFLFSGCTESNPLHSPIGTRPFQFDPKQVSELMITKFDPNTGDRWTATFKQTGNDWEIVSGPNNIILSDRKANSTFILHLLDAIRTLKIESNAPLGSLASLQLSPPRFGIRWNTPQGEFQFRLGSALKNPSSAYLTLDGTQPLQAQGSAIQMFDMIKSFQFLRKHTWTTVSSDDIDEIKIFQRGKPHFYAQREGDLWTDQKHHPLKKNVSDLLEKITNAQPLELVDHPEQVSGIKMLFSSDSSYQADLIDRKGKTTSLKLQKSKDRLYGLSSDRPSIAFVLEPHLFNSIFQ
jgi:hypothetical protein